MLGVWDYTVILTYMSAVSAVLGICVTLQGNGHPYWGTLFLLISGLCDTFDGTVARLKKGRTTREKRFGIQIDSLSDLLAFGALPACIGNALIRVSPELPEIPRLANGDEIETKLAILFFVIIVIYVLAALVRLAYFNVMEEERQNSEEGHRKYYEGLPVTSSALIFPTVLLGQYLTKTDITNLYFIVMAITAAAFVSKIKIPKPGTKGLCLIFAVVLLELIVLAIAWKPL